MEKISCSQEAARGVSPQRCGSKLNDEHMVGFEEVKVSVKE
jgi:hypothetical protein